MAAVGPDQAGLVVEALAARAGQRRRTAELLAIQLSSVKQEGRDIRSQALKVVDELAAAAQLDNLADVLAAGWQAMAEGVGQ